MRYPSESLSTDIITKIAHDCGSTLKEQARTPTGDSCLACIPDQGAHSDWRPQLHIGTGVQQHLSGAALYEPSCRQYVSVFWVNESTGGRWRHPKVLRE